MTSADIDAEELAAILGPAAALPAREELSKRDFSVPRRLGPARQEALARALQLARLKLELVASKALLQPCKIELLELREVGCAGLFDDLLPPFCLLQFRVDSQPGWMLWEIGPAVSAVEFVLGGAAGAQSPARELTPSEGGLLLPFLIPFAQECARALQREPTGFELVRSREQILEWREASSTPDPARVALVFGLEGPLGASALKLWLPGPAFPQPDAPPVSGQTLPSSVLAAQVELHAHLGGAEVSLEELLALEVGDVVPLAAKADEPLHLCIDGQAVAQVRLGTRHGALAVLIERLLPAAQPMGQPMAHPMAHPIAR
jgi:flagellar motor switch protein FliM